jgi:hypothetical protein
MADRPLEREGVVVEEERRYVTERPPTADHGLRVFQLIAAVAGATLFLIGLVAVFRVDFGARFFESSGDVAGIGFSAAAAIAGVLLGGTLLATALGDQDRGSTAFIGLLVLLVGIAGFIVEDQGLEEVDVDRNAAVLFVIVGAVAFVASLIPWWTTRIRR